MGTKYRLIPRPLRSYCSLALIWVKIDMLHRNTKCGMITKIGLQ